MRTYQRAIETSAADLHRHAGNVPGFIEERILCVKRAKAKAKLDVITHPVLAAKREILKAKAARI